MKFYGNIALNQNQLQQASLEVEADFPANPSLGRILFKDRTVFICVDISGSPVWIPLTQEIDTYVHFQNDPAITWNVQHQLHAATINAQVFDTNQKMLLPDDVTIISADAVSITFSAPIAGRAIIMSGSQFGGNPHPSYNFVFTQTSPSATWVINHGLGYEPIIRVFIGNEEVQPLSIVHNSLFQSTVTFSTVQTGIARCI